MNRNPVNTLQYVHSQYRIILEEHATNFHLGILCWNDSDWIRTAEMPLVVIKDRVIHPTDILGAYKKKNDFTIKLKSDEDGSFVVKTEILKKKSSTWIHVKTTVIFKKDLEFFDRGPEILLKLVPVSDSEEFLFINQPTKHTPPTVEWKSNDMPAGYVWNPGSRIETMIYVNLSEMSWMSPSTIPRFSHYECGFKLVNDFGFLFNYSLKEPVIFHKGSEICFDYYLTFRYQYKRPSKWEAVENLVSHCFQLLDSRIFWPKKASTWKNMAEKCISDLMKEGFCWIDKEAPKYYAYVNDRSEKKRREGWIGNTVFETMTMLDILPPWLLYLQLHDKCDQRDHVKRTTRSFDHFIDQQTGYLYNNITVSTNNRIKQIIPDKMSIGDSWYFFEPIIRFGWLALLHSSIHEDDSFLPAFKSMCAKSTEFVEFHDYKISAFYDPITLKPLEEAMIADPKRKELLIESRGANDIAWKIRARNYSCLGMYIYIMVQAYELFGERQFLDSAETAAMKYQEFSPNELFWEPIELAHTIAGYAELYRLTSKKNYIEFGHRLVMNLLRMFYWYNDNSFNWKCRRSTLGLVQACVGIRYPAMKENVESIYPLLPLIHYSGKLSVGLLKMINCLRINSFWYFSGILPDEFIYTARRMSPCENIPFEDLEMLETPPHFSKTQLFSPKGKRTGTLGREIYGAGEVIILYLLFEALAKCTSNRDIMVLNLDLFKLEAKGDYPPRNQHFIVFNPLPNNLDCKIEFYSPPGMKSRVEVKSLDKQELIVESVFTILNGTGILTVQIPAETGLFLQLFNESQA